MNLNIKIFLLCPIPDDQKPINEYLNLKENSFTNFLILSPKKYLLRLLINFIGFFILSTPILYLFNVKSNLFVFNSFFSLNCLFSIFLINFIRWSQLLQRFKTSRLFYEEGSWYDGQYWEKPLEIIKNDKLIAIYKIEPIVQRVVKTLTIIFLLIIFLYFNYIYS